jgi:RNA polymerase sigma-70 factor (ECF subfamily)
MRTSGLVARFPTISPPDTTAARTRDAAVEQLFDEHAPGLFRLARLMLRDADEAEDVVQETFLKLTAHLDAGRPLPNARAWLFTVAAHACRDRQRTRWRWLPWLPELDRRPSRDTADRADAAAPVLAALRVLPPRDRLLISLRAQGLDYNEISAAAGIRPSSVGRLLARAVDRLAARMAASLETQHE